MAIKSVKIAFRISKYYSVLLEKEAEKKRTNVSELMRTMVGSYFTNNDEKVDTTALSIEAMQSFLLEMNNSLHALNIKQLEQMEKNHQIELKIMMPTFKKICRALVVSAPDLHDEMKKIFVNPYVLNGEKN